MKGGEASWRRSNPYSGDPAAIFIVANSDLRSADMHQL